MYGVISMYGERQIINNVTGIYGQNASGKSSVIKAIDFVRKMVDYRYDETDSELLIHFDSNVANIRIQIECGCNIVDYIIFIKRVETSVIFEREQVFIDEQCVFDVDHQQQQVLKNGLVKSDYKTELTVIVELAYEFGKSCFGSKYSYERLSDSQLSNYPTTIKAIYRLSSKINIISDHDSSLNNIDDNLVIFDLNQDVIDDLTIDLDNNGLVKKYL